MKWFFAICSLILSLTIVSLALKIQEEKAKKRFSVHIPLDEKKFLQKVAAPAPEWMLRQIRKDLKPFEKGITREMIDLSFNEESSRAYGLVRFANKNGHWSLSLSTKNLDSRHFRYVLAAVKKLNQLVALPDVDFVMSDADGFDFDPGTLHCPVFVFSKSEGLDPFILMPDCKALTGYDQLRKEIAKANKKHPWDSKQPKAFWRGGPTGPLLTIETWQQRDRVKLALLSLAAPQDIDARINSVKKVPEIAKIMKARGLLGKWVDKTDHLKYKYLPDIDGNACTFERYFWLLASNSVAFKQTTPNLQWYYGALEPYRHYIPIKKDFSDLVQQIHWARTHDEEARKIAENGTEFVRTHLSTEDSFLYLYHLIAEYARLQKPQGV